MCDGSNGSVDGFRGRTLNLSCALYVLGGDQEVENYLQVSRRIGLVQLDNVLAAIDVHAGNR